MLRWYDICIVSHNQGILKALLDNSNGGLIGVVIFRMDRPQRLQYETLSRGSGST